MQVCDAGAPMVEPTPDAYMHAALTDRSLPGEGVVDIPALFTALADAGAAPFVAFEVYNERLALEPETTARALRTLAGTLFP